MSRVIALCFLLLAAVFGFLHIDSRPAWAPFATQIATQVEEELEVSAAPKSLLVRGCRRRALHQCMPHL
jgi:hypothetical protein